VDGVGQQGNGSADRDDDGLERGGDGQPGERELDGAHPFFACRQGDVDRLTGVVVVMVTVT
jgi:hypothetical protein